MVCTMSISKVKEQEASKEANLEAWGTLVEAKVIIRKVKRRMRRREEGWLAGRRRLRMPRKVSRADGTKSLTMCLADFLLSFKTYVISR